MPFKKRDLHLLTGWEPLRSYYYPDHDRLEVVTSEGDKLVLRWSSAHADSGSIIIDPNFMPQPLSDMPTLVKKHAGIDVTSDSWSVKVMDGPLTYDGPVIEFLVEGGGWQWRIYSLLTIAAITPMQLEYINQQGVARTLRGVTPDPERLEVRREADSHS